MSSRDVGRANAVVRPATAADLPTLDRLKPAPAVNRDRLRDAEQPGFDYLVLERDGDVIGFVCLVFVRPRYWSDGDSSEHLPTAIDFLIDEPLRSRGYGTFFLREVERLAAAAGATQLYIWVDPIDNPRALALYQRLGYQPLQQHPYEFHWHFTDSEGTLHEGESSRLDLVRPLL